MPIFLLPRQFAFPPVHLAEKDGLLAVGGDLSQGRLLMAYSLGIFPWYSEGTPILWWSPNPRLVLKPGWFIQSRSLRQVKRKGTYRITMDTAFEDVITRCASIPRKREQGTWITDEMRQAYQGLHRAGYCHSVESWYGDELSGGLYGVALGGAFFGESMFAERNDASKVALATLVRHLAAWGFSMIDCQVTTAHLKNLGGREVGRNDFMKMLAKALQMPTRRGRWIVEDHLLKL